MVRDNSGKGYQPGKDPLNLLDNTQGLSPITKIRLRVNKAFLLKPIISCGSMLSNIKLRDIALGIRKQRNKANLIPTPGKNL